MYDSRAHTIENEDRTLTDLINRVNGLRDVKQDYLSDTRELQLATAMNPEGEIVSSFVLERAGEPTSFMRLNSVARAQLGEKIGLPAQVVERLQQEYSGEFDRLVRAVFDKEPKKVMLRTYLDRDNQNNGCCRALVSSGFRCYDHEDVLGAVVPVLQASDAQWKVIKAWLTDSHMNLQFKSLVHVGDGAKVGDACAHGITIGNSEVARGAVKVAEMLWTLWCLNGASTRNIKRSAHITSSRGDSETWSILSNEAKDADNKALSLKLRDWTAEISSAKNFEKTLAQVRAAADDKIETTNAAAVEALGGILKLSKADTSNVLEGLIQTLQQPGYVGEPVSRATLFNAVTNVQNRAGPDKVTDWQALGGQVLNLPVNQWRSVATAEALAA